MEFNIDLTKSKVSFKNKAILNIEKIIFNCLQYTSVDKFMNYPKNIPNYVLKYIEKEAIKIRQKCKIFIVIGIGGSYLGTAAVYNILGSKKDCPELIFAGNNLDPVRHKEIINKIKENETYICMISKSGTTLESNIIYRILKEELIKKHGILEAKNHTIVITDPDNIDLKNEGYLSFDIPKNIGGRFSVFTPVSLLPLSVAGIDIYKFIEGAKELCNKKHWLSNKYALVRYTLEEYKNIEIFEYSDPRLYYLIEWIKQLFAESEGKEGKGLFLTSAILPTDLHSIGQYLQEGKQQFFETIITINDSDDIIIDGISLNNINKSIIQGMIDAHDKIDIPIIQISITNDERSIGQLLYYLQMTTIIKCRMSIIDPFTQNGVEQYKKEAIKYIKD